MVGAVSALILAQDPGVAPNGSGLPGLGTAREMTGALLTAGLIASVAALAISAAVWGFSSNAGNYHGASKGKTGVLVSCGAAVLIGGANLIITFFADAGSALN